MVMKLEFVVLFFVSLAYNVFIYAINQVLQFKCVSEVFCLFNNFKTLDEAIFSILVCVILLSEIWQVMIAVGEWVKIFIIAVDP